MSGGHRAAALLAAALLAGGCSNAADKEDPAASKTVPTRAERPAPAPPPEAAHCPGDLPNCRTATGRILYVERVDPDGDGDAHFVLVSRDAITAPGVSVIDVKKALRPSPLPGPGDRLSAAGPVYRGSYGQEQIEAIEVHVAPRTRTR